MQYKRPNTITLGLAAVLFATPAFGQATPPRKVGTVSGDTVEMMRARTAELGALRQRIIERRDGGMGRGGGPEDFGRFLFPPEMVMQHQRDLALTDQQQVILAATMAKLESDVVGWNWKMASEQQKLTELVQATPVDSVATLAQIDKVLDLERQIKRAHVAALVRIKNTLTADQQHVLRTLEPPGSREMLQLDYGPAGRGRMGPPDGGRGRRGGGGGEAPPPDGH